MAEITRSDVVSWQVHPKDWTRTRPFTATIHIGEGDLTIKERSIIESALINAAHEIKNMRGQEEPFTRHNTTDHG